MAQFGRPSADTNNQDSYTNQAGSGTNIFQAIDEAIADDADYVRSPSAPTSDVYVTKLSAVTDPLVATGHVLRTRYAKDVASGATINVVVQLRQGYTNEGAQGTLIATRTFSDVSATFAQDSYSLTADEANAITDYSDLYVRMVINQP